MTATDLWIPYMGRGVPHVSARLSSSQLGLTDIAQDITARPILTGSNYRIVSLEAKSGTGMLWRAERVLYRQEKVHYSCKPFLASRSSHCFHYQWQPRLKLHSYRN